MADLHTIKATDRQTRFRQVVPVAMGMGLGVLAATLFDLHPTKLFIENVNGMIGFPILGSWLEDPGLARDMADWAAAPTLFAMVGFGLAKLPGPKHLLEWWFPDPPPFAIGDLEAATSELPGLASSKLTRLVGQASALAALESEDDEGFHWRWITGPGGVGKTRLSVEWLARRRRDGWHAGIVDPRDLGLIDRWRPARRTALLIDCGTGEWLDIFSVLAKLARASGRGQCAVHILVASEGKMVAGLDADGNRAIVEPGALEEVRVEPLSRVELDQLRAAYGAPTFDLERLEIQSQGLPRAALLVLAAPTAVDLQGALRLYVQRLLPELADPKTAVPLDLSVALCVSALVGPIATNSIREVAGPLNLKRLSFFFPRSSRAELEVELPKPLPAQVAQQLLLAILAQSDVPVRQMIVKLAAAHDSDRFEEAVGRCWAALADIETSAQATGESPEIRSLRELQREFDEVLPEAATRINAAMAAAWSRVSDGENTSEIRGVVAFLSEAAAQRPFDENAWIYLAAALAQALRTPNEASPWRAGVECFRHLTEITRSSRFVDDEQFGYFEAKALANLSLAVQESQSQSRSQICFITRGFRRCSARAHRDSQGDALVALSLICAHAVRFYTADENEHRALALRWLGRFERLKAMTSSNELELLRSEGDIAVRLIYLFCGTLFLDREVEARWRAKIEANTARFPEDSILANLSRRAVVNACRNIELDFYDGLARIRQAEIEAFERGAEPPRLDSIPLGEDQALVIATASKFYLHHHRPDLLEALKARIDNVAAREDWYHRLMIQEAIVVAAANAVNFYGLLKARSDVERWGSLLTALMDRHACVSESLIARPLVRGATSAMLAYDPGSPRFDFWRAAVARIARLFPGDAVIQSQANLIGLSYIEQRNSAVRR